jgi:hypothetical protein
MGRVSIGFSIFEPFYSKIKLLKIRKCPWFFLVTEGGFYEFRKNCWSNFYVMEHHVSDFNDLKYSWQCIYGACERCFCTWGPLVVVKYFYHKKAGASTHWSSLGQTSSHKSAQNVKIHD